MRMPRSSRQKTRVPCQSNSPSPKHSLNMREFQRLLLLPLLLLLPHASASCQLTYLGCYVDSPDRVLPTQTADAFTCLTREYCAALCAAIAAPISGAEFAGQCFCGPSLPSSAVKVADSECNMACSGDNQTTCGGSYRISVSSAVCTGPPQPSPCAYNVSTAPPLHLGCPPLPPWLPPPSSSRPIRPKHR
jgi:hypothetical protein